MRNLYFELTEELNAEGAIAVLASGQAVVYYRLAILSKDGDWILRETPEACRRALGVLERHGARYRPSAPLDVRWLSGGWSSHFEFADPEGRRIRCDFVTRPPRVAPEELSGLFAPEGPTEGLKVVGIEPLIRMKQTQRGSGCSGRRLAGSCRSGACPRVGPPSATGAHEVGDVQESR